MASNTKTKDFPRSLKSRERTDKESTPHEDDVRSWTVELESEADMAFGTHFDDKDGQRSISGDSNTTSDTWSIDKEIDVEKLGNASSSKETDWDKSTENPLNWGHWKRLWHIMNSSLLSWLVTFASSVPTPANAQIAEQFHVSETTALLVLSLYTLGLAFGPVLAAPISETLGRNIVYKASTLGFILFTLGAGLSRTFAALCVCRFFAGMAGAPVLAIGGGTMADVLPAHDRGVGSGYYLLAAFLGPATGPFIGGFVAQDKSWQWTQWVILLAAIPIFLMGLTTSETYQKIIKKRLAQQLAKRQGKSVSNQDPIGKDTIKAWIKLTLIRPLSMLVIELTVFSISVYTAFTFAVIFMFFAVFPVIFQRVYGFDTSQTGIAFLAFGIGYVFALITIIFVDRKIYRKHYLRVKAAGGTTVAPEKRLYTAMFGSFLVPIGLFWFAWTAQKSVHWISPVLAAIPFAWGNLCIFWACASYLIDVYGPLAGASSLAANGMARYTLSACFPLFAVQMYDKLGINWATSLLGFFAIAFLPVPWVLFIWGPRIRAHSRYNTM